MSILSITIIVNRFYHFITEIGVGMSTGGYDTCSSSPVPTR